MFAHKILNSGRKKRHKLFDISRVLIAEKTVVFGWRIQLIFAIIEWSTCMKSSMALNFIVNERNYYYEPQKKLAKVSYTSTSILHSERMKQRNRRTAVKQNKTKTESKNNNNEERKNHCNKWINGNKKNMLNS